MKSNLSVKRVKGVAGIDQEHTFVVIWFKGSSYRMHCSFNSSDLSPTQLKTSSGVLYVLPSNGEDCFSNNPSGSVSNTYRTYTWGFIQGDKPAGKLGWDRFGINIRCADPPCCQSERVAYVSRGTFIWCTYSSPIVCVYARWSRWAGGPQCVIPLRLLQRNVIYYKRTWFFIQKRTCQVIYIWNT